MIDLSKMDGDDIISLINMILLGAAIWKLARCLLISKMTELYLRGRRSIRFILTQDKLAYERAVRFIVTLMVSSDLMVFLWSANRFMYSINYSTDFIKYTSIIFSILMFLKAYFLMKIFKGDDLNMFKRERDKNI